MQYDVHLLSPLASGAWVKLNVAREKTGKKQRTSVSGNEKECR